MHLIFMMFFTSLLQPGVPDRYDSDPPMVYRGDAVDLDERTPLYVEEHEEAFEGGTRIKLLTTYRDVTGDVIAKRTTDFSNNTLLPTFRLDDVRTGYVEGVEVHGDSVRLYWRNAGSEPMQEKIMAIPHPAIVDAGFNNFVQEQWDSLMGGATLEMNFGVPSKLDYYQFRLYKDSESMIDGRNVVVMKCDIDNFFLRIFVKPIVLTYDRESHRMVSYEGISNINNVDGKSYVVQILYNPFGP